MGQLRKGMKDVEPAALIDQVEKDLESIKWHLWNGNIDPALELISDLRVLLESEQASPERQKLFKSVREFGAYLAANQAFIPDYGDRYRNKTIATAFVESPVQSSGEQTNSQAATNALERTRSASVATSSCPSAQ